MGWPTFSIYYATHEATTCFGNTDCARRVRSSPNITSTLYAGSPPPPAECVESILLSAPGQKSGQAATIVPVGTVPASTYRQRGITSLRAMRNWCAERDPSAPPDAPV